MSYAGTWVVVERENMEAFLKHVGASDEEIAGFQKTKMVQTYTQDGDNFTLEKTLPNRTVKVSFTLGQKTTLANIRGQEIKDIAVNKVGNKLVAEAPNFYQSCEIVDGKLVDIISAGGMTFKRISVRQ